MTALENVMVGRHVRTRAGLLGALLRGPDTRAEEREIAAAARALLAKVGLGAVADEPAASLPYGLQRRLEIARALATRPLLLLLDEPAAGMNPRETAELDELIRRLRDEDGVTILLIEHDMRLVMGLAERIVVLDCGRLIAAGTPRQVRADPAVIRAYLGEPRDRAAPSRTARGGGRVRRDHGARATSASPSAQGEIVTLIGANGAGKSTTLMSICGVLPARAGEILLDGQPIHRRTPADIVRRGVVQVPEGRRIFPRLSVTENLEMGAFCRSDPAGVRRDRDAVHALFPVLAERGRQPGGTLSGGEQQMLAIGRALMAGPRLLLLDEPSLGLAPLLVRQIFEIIVRINRERGTTILLVEQNAHLALQIAHRGYVLENGRIVIEGTGAGSARRPGGTKRLPRPLAGGYPSTSLSTAPRPAT